uniref:Aldo_ket_red domain-containing protein n=1 Tax=Bursaphelenchus xylophilus TaxID=6326 RepID=A0A1I7S0E1_BURXY
MFAIFRPESHVTVGKSIIFTINEDGIKAIQGALDAGYRLIDTASAYNNEEEVGKALEEYFKSGKLSRKDVFITTKLWCNNSRPEDVEPTLRKQLAALRTDYVDLYLIHHPTAYNMPSFFVAPSPNSMQIFMSPVDMVAIP